VAGERLDRVIANQAASKGVSEDEVRQQFASGAPLARFVDPEDIASATRFLASDQALSITGEDLNVSAGTVTY
jgi:NAD(P)-dependent dehydrogenase (short-subunit alcohol dehydrogenase family)